LNVLMKIIIISSTVLSDSRSEHTYLYQTLTVTFLPDQCICWF
jgi:hypothetical protein